MSNIYYPAYRPFQASCSARKMALREHNQRATAEAIEAVRVHMGFGRRQVANLLREPAFDRSNRRS